MILLWLLAACFLLFAAGTWSIGSDPVPGALALIAAGTTALVAWNRAAWWGPLRAHAIACGDAVDRLPRPESGAWIALAAGASLLGELILIRWHGASFLVFSYFKNVSLLAAFLGLGIGYASARRPLLITLAVPAIAAQIVLLHVLGMTTVHTLLQSPISEQRGLGLAYTDLVGHWLLTYGLLLSVFIASIGTCIPLGQLAGRTMLALPPLRAYTWNLVGSLAAVAAFAGLSMAWSPPSVWLAVVVVALVPYLQAAPRPALAAAVVASAIAGTVLAMPHRLSAVDFYSPYQIVTVRARPPAPPVIEASRSYFQQMWDLRPEFMVPGTERMARYYALPYFFKPAPARVLIVGSGAGNDVAAALRHGAGHVDAVEIDPLILRLGQDLHPEQPYADRRVRAIVEDARSYVRHSDAQYDLIVYGLLDSHTVLAGASSVRLDSYVYTMEAFREARARLAPDGVIVMSFTLVSREIAWKLFLMLRAAFGEDPRAFETQYDGGIAFVAGPGLRAGVAVPFEDVTRGMYAARVEADVSTDDWPFLYMARRQYPRSYLLMAASLLMVAWVAVRSTAPRTTGGFSPVAFLLGAGFMLVETKAITELALVFGSAWHVTSAVIAGVLVMALLANAWASRGNVPARLIYPFLLASVLAGTVAHAAGLQAPPLVERLVATALATVPLFFSGLAFSSELRRHPDPPALLSSNLFGAVVGGLLEYNSMYIGIRALALVALALYGAAWWASARSGRAVTP